MNTCPHCQGIGFVEHGHQGECAMLPCHFCDAAGELDLDSRLNDMEVAFAVPVFDNLPVELMEDYPF